MSLYLSYIIQMSLKKYNDLEQSFEKTEHFFVALHEFTSSLSQIPLLKRWRLGSFLALGRGAGHPKSLGIRTCSPNFPVAENNFPTKGRRGLDALVGCGVLFLSRQGYAKQGQQQWIIQNSLLWPTWTNDRGLNLFLAQHMRHGHVFLKPISFRHPFLETYNGH